MRGACCWSASGESSCVGADGDDRRYLDRVRAELDRSTPAQRLQIVALPVPGQARGDREVRLAARRFPHTVIRRRGTPGHRDDFGEYVEGTVEEVELRASVQPMSLEDADQAGGVQVSHRLSVYVPEPGALSAAFMDDVADTVIYGGHEFVVEESQSWPGSHCRAILLRET